MLRKLNESLRFGDIVRSEDIFRDMQNTLMRTEQPEEDAEKAFPELFVAGASAAQKAAFKHMTSSAANLKNLSSLLTWIASLNDRKHTLHSFHLLYNNSEGNTELGRAKRGSAVELIQTYCNALQEASPILSAAACDAVRTANYQLYSKDGPYAGDDNPWHDKRVTDFFKAMNSRRTAEGTAPAHAATLSEAQKRAAWVQLWRRGLAAVEAGDTDLALRCLLAWANGETTCYLACRGTSSWALSLRHLSVMDDPTAPFGFLFYINMEHLKTDMDGIELLQRCVFVFLLAVLLLPRARVP
jgi:hypothetical protein